MTEQVTAVYAKRIPKEDPHLTLLLSHFTNTATGKQVIEEVRQLVTKPCRTVIKLEEMYIAIGQYTFEQEIESEAMDIFAEGTKPQRRDFTPEWFNGTETDADAVSYRGRSAIDILLHYYYVWRGNALFREAELALPRFDESSEFGLVSKFVDLPHEGLLELAKEFSGHWGTLGVKCIGMALQANNVKLKPGIYPTGVSCFGDPVQVVEIKPVAAVSELLQRILYKSKTQVWSSTGFGNADIASGSHIIGLLAQELEIDIPIQMPRLQPGERLKLSTPKTEDNKMFPPIQFDTDGILEINGDITIQGKDGEPALYGKGILTIEGTGTLTLISGKKSGCIGEETQYPQSYNRWTPPSWQELRELRLTGGITVICKSYTDNFSIGGYGCDWMPKIMVEEGCRLLAPEWGKAGLHRKMTYSGEHYDGSTKLTGDAVYVMVADDTGMVADDTASLSDTVETSDFRYDASGQLHDETKLPGFMECSEKYPTFNNTTHF